MPGRGQEVGHGWQKLRGDPRVQDGQYPPAVLKRPQQQAAPVGEYDQIGKPEVAGTRRDAHGDPMGGKPCLSRDSGNRDSAGRATTSATSAPSPEAHAASVRITDARVRHDWRSGRFQ